MLAGISAVHWLALLSAGISLAGSANYIHNTIKGRTKPNRISWGMWALAPLVITAAAISNGADLWSISRTFLAGFIPLVIFLISFINKQSYWKLTLFDFLCGLCSIIALILWLFIKSPQLAILVAAAGDCFAGLPILRKAWKYPETESGLIFITSLISVLLILPSIPQWNMINITFPIYLLIENALIILGIYRKRFHLF